MLLAAMHTSHVHWVARSLDSDDAAMLMHRYRGGQDVLHVAPNQHCAILLSASQRASAADIRLLTSTFKIGAKVEGHATHSAIFYLLMKVPEYAVQGVSFPASPYVDLCSLEQHDAIDRRSAQCAGRQQHSLRRCSDY